LANAAQGESGRSPEDDACALEDDEEAFAASAFVAFSVSVLSVFDEQPESAATVATSPPVSMVLRSGCPALPISISSFRPHARFADGGFGGSKLYQSPFDANRKRFWVFELRTINR
jgi:hypothetical protein